jgi:hypothetical protein
MRAFDKRKSISLCLRGFEMHPDDVESLVGVIAESKGVKGQPVRPNTKNLLRRSYVDFEIFMPPDTLLFAMLPALFEYLGGVEHLTKVREQVNPEFFEINFDLPVKNSEEQEGGFLELQSIADVHKLQATLSFGFL